ncbi:hypothetical protein [Burkholderia mallei]|uniref:hypothetical protein n=1 Tax=Burkholderia mallei TaxID=13373 RepID=UPI003B985B59
MTTRYAEYFPQFLKRGVEAELLDDKLLQFDLKRLGDALDASRDLQFGYLGCRRCTTATSCTSTAPASKCLRRSSCASRWASR